MANIRQLQVSDIPAIMELNAEVGFPARSGAGWHWALFENPDQGDIPAGLACIRDGRLISMIGLQARDFRHDGQPLKGLVGHTFISGKAGRGAGFGLARRALNIPGVAAIYSLNNNALAGHFHKRVGLSAWMQSSGRKRIEWPIRTIAMWTGLTFSKLARSEKLHDRLSAREWFGAPYSRLDTCLLSQSGNRFLDPEKTEDAAHIDEFGEAICNGRSAAPVRRASAYAYQMSDPDAPGRIALIGHFNGGQMTGLLQAIITKPNPFEPSELEIIDLAIRPGTQPAISLRPLIRDARSMARQAGLARVRLVFPDRFAASDFKGTGPRLKRTYRYDSAHAWFNPDAAGFEQAWQPSGYEGDFFFALRIAPGLQA